MVHSMTTPLPAPLARPTRSVAPPRACAGLRRIVRYNWPAYAVALLLIGTALTTLVLVEAHAVTQFVLLFVAAVAGWWTFGSLFASWWVYDRSTLYRFTWLPRVLPRFPRQWAAVHAGLDDLGPAVATLFPQSRGRTLDIFDAASMTESSLRRARAVQTPDWPARPCRAEALALDDGEIDTAFLFLSAHEVRDATQRRALFAELDRALTPGGQVLLVEHARDAANALAYGPGAYHFYPPQVWRDLGAGAGWISVSVQRITPFVRILVWRKTP